MDLTLIALAFAAIFVVELPDKTFIAALVLSTRYRPGPVWAGVGLAFGVQTLIAVTLGKVVSFLPADVVHGVAALIFLAGAAILVWQAPRAVVGEQQAQDEYAAKAGPDGPDSPDSPDKTGWAVVLVSFLVLFAAEWGDLSQLLTISLVGRYGDPVSVFLGAWGALLAVSGLAVLAGRFLLRHIRLSLIHYLGAGVCLLLAAATIHDLVR